MAEKKHLNIHGIIGVTVLAVAHVLFFKRVDPFLSWFYMFAWWSYILTVDGIVYRLKGNSLLLSRTREFLVMICWSFTIWLFFEMVNLVMRNWYYINVPNSAVVRFFGYAVSFGTVLPGLFETTELLETLGLFRNTSVPRIRVTQRWYVMFLAIGALFLTLPLIFPRYTFPLIWGSFIFLLEPINHRFGGKSLLGEWERGSLRKFYLLLTAGLICGGLWEFWNFWARTKWIYTVPFFDELKLFEMPLLGFLGFPPFAVECYVIGNFISLFRHKRGWEQDAYKTHGERKTSWALKLITTLTILLFYVLSTRAIDRYTVHSTLAVLDDFPYLTAEEKKELHRLGIHTADGLAYRVRTPEQYDRFIETLNIPPNRLAEMVTQARLIALKGLGSHHFLLLETAGIDSVERLAHQDPEALHEKLVGVRRPNSTKGPPTRAQIKVWILAARQEISR